VMARTELANAYAEAQLDAFQQLGIDEVGVLAEWLTAGDDRVCELCGSLEGRTFTVEEARGMIPQHPQCRCAWLPAIPDRRGRKSTRHDRMHAAVRNGLRRIKQGR